MGGVVEAIRWSGTGVTISLFVVTGSAERPSVTMVHGPMHPDRVRRYELMDEDEVLAGRSVYEFDAEFGDVPSELTPYLAACLAQALDVGGLVAWLGFEGSFDFLHLLTDDIASEVYGIGDADGVAVVLADWQIRSSGWLDRVRAARSRLFADVPMATRQRRHAEGRVTSSGHDGDSTVGAATM